MLNKYADLPFLILNRDIIEKGGNTMKLPERFTLNIVLLAALIIFTLSAVHAYILSLQLVDSNKLVNHTHMVIETASNARTDLAEESVQTEKYAYFKDQKYITNLSILFKNFNTDIALLKTLTADNAIQQIKIINIEKLLKEKMHLQSAMLKVLAASDQSQFQQQTTKQALLINDQMMLILNSIIQEEVSLLQVRNLARDYYRSTTKSNFISTLLVGEVFLLFTLLLLNIHLSKRNKIEKKLLDAESKLIKSEKSLLENKERYDLAVKGSNTGLWDWDCNTNKVFYTEEFRRMLGYNEEEFPDLFSSFDEILHPDDKERVYKLVEDHLTKKIPYKAEYRLKRKSGEFSWYQGSGEAIRNEKGEVVRMSGSLVDISERKELDKAKNEFISVVSHELRTPLTSIHGSISLLANGGVIQLSDDAKQLIGIAKNNCERLIRLINDILDIEKIESGKVSFHLSPLEINRILEDSIKNNQSFADKFSVKLILKNSLKNVYVLTDYDRLMQVMTNLISNAVKFSPINSEVIVTTEIQSGFLRVSIIDHGKGIPKDFEPYIFQKFSQADSSASRKYQGTGLGLNISKTIIEKLGGTIQFVSIPGSGTTFYFDIPLHNALQKTTTTTKKSMQSDLPLVLIGEHDQDTARLIADNLSKENFKTKIAKNVEEINECINLHAIDVLILDINMPNQDGFAFLLEMKNKMNKKNIPVVIIAMQVNEAGNQLIGGSIHLIDWINKPIDIDKLHNAIKKIRKSINIRPIKILHVEDDVELSQVVAKVIHSEGVVTNVTTVEQAKAAIQDNAYDVAILDLMLPDGSGLSLLSDLSDHKIPIVVYSAYDLPDEYSQFVSSNLLKSKCSNEDLVHAIKMAFNIKVAKEKEGHHVETIE